MVKELDGARISADITLSLDASGKNTIFPLIQGFRALRTRCFELVESPAPHRHGNAGIPGWVNENGLFAFPFRSKYAVLDLDPAARDELLDELQAFAGSMDRAKVADVRNRLEHHREDSFPTRHELLDLCSGVSRAVERAQRFGICPSVYRFRTEQTDEFGRSVVRLADYRGDEVGLFRDNELALIDYPGPRAPQLVFHGARLNGTSQCLRFELQPESAFSAMWREFAPRHRRVLPVTVEDEGEALSD
jgi:hypothetical protein